MDRCQRPSSSEVSGTADRAADPQANEAFQSLHPAYFILCPKDSTCKHVLLMAPKPQEASLSWNRELRFHSILIFMNNRYYGGGKKQTDTPAVLPHCRRTMPSYAAILTDCRWEKQHLMALWLHCLWKEDEERRQELPGASCSGMSAMPSSIKSIREGYALLVLDSVLWDE